MTEVPKDRDYSRQNWTHCDYFDAGTHTNEFLSMVVAERLPNPNWLLGSNQGLLGSHGADSRITRRE